MPEHPGFDFTQIDGRSIVRLRVRPNGADAAAKALDLPVVAMQFSNNDPRAHWLGPDQWLITSDTRSVDDIVMHVDAALSGHLYAATDMSSQNSCFSLTGPTARIILAMGCGIDLHPGALQQGQCVRTHFANVALLIVAVNDNDFELYVDRSYAGHLGDWIINSGEDPITRDSKYYEITVS